MSSRSLNKVQIIELRYTPQGTAVCQIGVATNRSWTNDAGEKNEETEFHKVVAWSKLAEICSQLLKKGRKIYLEGRLQTRDWTTQDGQKRQTTEIVMDNMILLDSAGRGGDGEGASTSYTNDDTSSKPVAKKSKKADVADDASSAEEAPVAEDVSDDIPF